MGIVSHTALPYNHCMEFIEATAFTKHVYEYLSDEEYLGLQSFLLQYPEAGKIENIPAHILRQIAKEIENV